MQVGINECKINDSKERPIRRWKNEKERKMCTDNAMLFLNAPAFK